MFVASCLLSALNFGGFLDPAHPDPNTTRPHQPHTPPNLQNPTATHLVCKTNHPPSRPFAAPATAALACAGVLAEYVEYRGRCSASASDKAEYVSINGDANDEGNIVL